MPNEIYHYNAITMRVVGLGNLVMSLSGFDDFLVNTLLDLPLSETNYKEPTRLANFNSQRARLICSVDTLGSWFKINNITIWVKPSATGYPM